MTPPEYFSAWCSVIWAAIVGWYAAHPVIGNTLIGVYVAVWLIVTFCCMYKADKGEFEPKSLVCYGFASLFWPVLAAVLAVLSPFDLLFKVFVAIRRGWSYPKFCPGCGKPIVP